VVIPKKQRMAEEFGAPGSSLDAPPNVGPDSTPVSGTIFINDLAYGTTEKASQPQPRSRPPAHRGPFRSPSSAHWRVWWIPVGCHWAL
jgi:hypothetical protein